MTELEAKLAVHQAAAVLTAGVMSNVVDNLQPDATVPAAAQVQNSMTWQIHKIFYHGLVGALTAGDATSWPAPPADKAAGPALDGSMIRSLVDGAVRLGGPALLQAMTPEAIAAIRALVVKAATLGAAPATPPAAAATPTPATATP